MRYQVIVGNIGTVYDGNDYFEACKVYGEYKQQSKGVSGRASGEDVTLMKDDELLFEHIGWNSPEGD
jgi:hypothetical protein